MPLSRELPSAGSVTGIDLAEYVGDANDVGVTDGGDRIRSGRRTEDRYLPLDFGTGVEVGLYLAEGSFDSGTAVRISNLADGVREFLDERGYNVYERTCNKGFRPYAAFLTEEFGRGSGDKRLPGWVFDAPAGFRAGLLSGYVDGDGTVEERTVTAMSRSEELLEGLAELLRQFGVSTTLRETFVLYDDRRRRYRRLSVDSFCVERFAELVDLHVERKAAELDRLLGRLEEGDGYDSEDQIPGFGPVLNVAAREAGWTNRESDRRLDGASVHHLTRKQEAGRETYNRLVEELGVGGRARAFGRSDVQWKRVVSVEPLDDERTVYDLDVAVNDNFVADGVFVHNSNTTSVIAEELLDRDLPLLLVDTDGEYFGLKEEYEILHVGRTEDCDAVVGPEHADRLARLALEEHVPIVLDVSGYLDAEAADELIAEVATALFRRERQAQQPFLLLVEEMHEYLPEGRGRSDAGDALVQIAKRGRKRGLGLCGVSQRPAAVAKEFITQCDWLCWHRLTWDNDTKVARRILGEDAAEAVQELDDGEALLMADWDEQVRQVQFRRKRTFDAGATPGLEGMDRPQLNSVSSDLVAELSAVDGGHEQAELGTAPAGGSERADSVTVEDGDPADADADELRERLGRKDARIAELEGRVEELRAERRRARRRERSEGGPLWELGQLTAYLFRAAGRSLRSAGRRLTGAETSDAEPVRRED